MFLLLKEQFVLSLWQMWGKKRKITTKKCTKIAIKVTVILLPKGRRATKLNLNVIFVHFDIEVFGIFLLCRQLVRVLEYANHHMRHVKTET